MAAPLLLRGIPLLRNRLLNRSRTTLRFLPSVGRPAFFTTTTTTPSNPNDTEKTEKLPNFSPNDDLRNDNNPHFRQWKDKEAEILEDIEPIIFLTKQILHSDRYIDGESLTVEDEKAVLEKLLAYHPHSQDKIGCGLDSIMVDRHPQFRRSRCLFVVRTDGGWIDFSYQKCLRAYIRNKYPSYAQRFIRGHFKRTST